MNPEPAEMTGPSRPGGLPELRAAVASRQPPAAPQVLEAYACAFFRMRSVLFLVDGVR